MAKRKKAVLAAALLTVAGLLVLGSVLTSAPRRSEVPGVVALSREDSAGTLPGTPPATGLRASSETQSAAAEPLRPAKAEEPKATLVRDPVPLAKVEQAPSRTLAFIQPFDGDDGDAYDIAFVPYGWGPGGKDRSIVVKVERLVAVGKPRHPLKLDGRNVILDVASLPGGQKVRTGGRREGTIELARKGNVLVCRLRKLR